MYFWEWFHSWIIPEAGTLIVNIVRIGKKMFMNFRIQKDTPVYTTLENSHKYFCLWLLQKHKSPFCNFIKKSNKVTKAKPLTQKTICKTSQNEPSLHNMVIPTCY